jgi:plasmid stabilization system protein ParE
MKLFWTETAQNDLTAIRRFIAADNPNAAKQFKIETLMVFVLPQNLQGTKIKIYITP